jgi:hypothetical protein
VKDRFEQAFARVIRKMRRGPTKACKTCKAVLKVGHCQWTGEKWVCDICAVRHAQ